MPNTKQALSAALEQLQAQAKKILSRKARRHQAQQRKSFQEGTSPAAAEEAAKPQVQNQDGQEPVKQDKSWRDEDAPERQLFPGAKKSWQEGSG